MDCKKPGKTKAPEISWEKVKKSLRKIQCGGEDKMTVKTKTEGDCGNICRSYVFRV